MKATFRLCLAPLWAGALAALLAGGVLAPTAARAGCSHYVVARSDPHGLTVLTDLDILAEARRAGSLPTPADRPSPCSGLSCSRDPMPPLVPSSPTLRTDLWVCLTDRPLTADPRPADFQADFGPLHPIHRATPPARPPRPLA